MKKILIALGLALGLSVAGVAGATAASAAPPAPAGVSWG